jgi:hypothetical protein
VDDGHEEGCHDEVADDALGLTPGRGSTSPRPPAISASPAIECSGVDRSYIHAIAPGRPSGTVRWMTPVTTK